MIDIVNHMGGGKRFILVAIATKNVLVLVVNNLRKKESIYGGRHLLLFFRFTGKQFYPKSQKPYGVPQAVLPELNRPSQTLCMLCTSVCTTQVITRSMDLNQITPQRAVWLLGF